MVKRLDDKEKEAIKPAKQEQDLVFYTERIADPKEAVAAKMKQLQGSIFGKSIVNVEILEQKEVWVPYCFLHFHLHVDRTTGFFSKKFDKDVEVGIVYDFNECHPFQYDFIEEGELDVKRKKIGELGAACKAKNKTDEEMIQQTEEFIQRRIAKKFYGRPGTLTLKEKKHFYRPAIEMETAFKNGKGNTRYAYLDKFGISSEHILGLKVRVENNL